MVVLRTPKELLTLDTDFAAVPDIGWPDCFNSGMMVLNPNMSDYYALYALAQRGISFDGADQGLLNMHFREWERLSFVYNCTPSGHYQYVPAYRHFQSSIAAVHFIGADKPWTLGRDNQMSNGVYGELLGMWWSVYDKHYRPKVRASLEKHPSCGANLSRRTIITTRRRSIPGKQCATMFGVKIKRPRSRVVKFLYRLRYRSAMLPLLKLHRTSIRFPPPSKGDSQHPKLIGILHGRLFVISWDASLIMNRAPPPSQSKPEAANFPTTIYDMSSETTLFQPPSHYPEAPKGMWYDVPQKAPEPAAPRHVFPWEARAPKATRVFPQARQPTPPPPPPMTAPAIPDEESTPSASGGQATKEVALLLPPDSPPEPANVWDSFQQRSNAWDDMPEIERYVQNISLPRKGKIQVLYNTLGQRSPRSTSGATTPTDQSRRRPSMKLTDFPTKDERPSLPVTPAPVRRGTIWGEDKEGEGTLPTAEGVPKQEEWVRRFSHYPQPEFPHSRSPPHDLPRVLQFQCQYCGRQNPLTKLEELQRRQSQTLLSPTGTRELEDVPEPPTRKMPESSSKEEVVEAAMSHISPTRTPKVPKPILKAPHFELGQEHVPSPAQNPTETAPDVDGLDPLSKMSEVELADDSVPPVAEAAPLMAATKA